MNRIFKGRVKRVKTWFSLPLIILFLGIVFAYPNLDFYSPTEPNNSYISTNWAEINLTVDMNETLDTFDFDWDYTEMDNYLVGYWILDESSGTNAYDSSGTGNNGTLNGMNTGLNNGTSGWTTSGKKQNAAMFDGADDYINCGNDSSLNITEAITIEAWVKPVDLVTSGLRIVHKNLAYSLFISDLNNSLRFWNYNDNSYGQSTASYTENEWQHVVVIKSGTTVNFYRNGIDVTNDGSISATLGTSAVDLMIGLDEDLSSYPFNGTIDEVRIYNTSLTPEQIKQRYLSTRARFYDDSLVLAMNFNNNSAIGENSTKAADISKYGNNGTINSATWTTNGKFGGALDFDGTDDYVDCGNDSSLNPKKITVEAWIYPTTLDISKRYFIVNNWGGGSDRSYLLGIEDNELRGYLSTDGSAGAGYFISFPSTQTFSINTWYHTVMTFDGTEGKLYINGVQNGSDTLSGDLFQPTTINILIGKYSDECFNGTIDEVRIYNRSLSADEILMHYQSEFSKYNSTEWRFYDNVTNLTDGSYSYYGWANDTAGNSGKTDSGNLRYLTVETISPAITLISPPDNEVDYDKNITFNYNVTDDSDIINCSLILNGILNQTNSSITKDTMQNFTLNNLALGDYIWSINCTDASNNIGASETRIVFSEVAITEFSGDTTDLTQIENLSNITNLIFDQPDYGKINFSEIVDLSSGGDINSYVNISQNRIEIDSTVLPVLNKAARLRLYNLTFTNPRILKDGIVCSDCAEVSYSGGIFVFDVTSFSTYSTEETPMTIEETLSYLGGGYPIYKPTQEQLKEGYEKILKKNWKIKFKVNNEYHQLKVDSVGDKTVAITVSSTPQQAILSIGEEKKFEVTGDNYYDFYVKLNSITNNAANLIIKKIHEEKVCEEKTKRCYTNLLQQCLDNSWQLIQTCEFSCNESLLKCNPKPTGKICNLGEKRCLGNELQECRNNNWVAIETCEHGCNSSGLACSSKQTVAEPEKLNYLIYFLVILIIGGISSVVYINRKNTEKFRESKEELKKKIQGNRKQNKQTKTGRKRCNKNRRRIKSSKK